MKNLVIKKEALKRIKAIHALSALYNKKVKKNHNQRLLELMREHVVEVEELINQKNKHGLIETGDLLILCFELLIENKMSIDDVLCKCFKRYEDKLGSLLSEV